MKKALLLVAVLLGILAFALISEAPGKEVDLEPIVEAKVDERILALEHYFSKRGMPLEEYAEKLVVEADRNSLDWRLLPAIAVQESSGGIHACGGNVFGWASCRITFSSIDEAIETVARNLGGNNPRTHAYYKGDTLSKLWSYNGTVDPTYPDRVVRIMGSIGE